MKKMEKVEIKWSKFVKQEEKPIQLENNELWPSLANSDSNKNKCRVSKNSNELNCRNESEEIETKNNFETDSNSIKTSKNKNVQIENKRVRNALKSLSKSKDQHLQIIDECVLNAYRQAKSSPTIIDKLRKNKKFKKTSSAQENLLDFLKKDPKTEITKLVKEIPKTSKIQNPIIRHKGKRREIRKEHHSRLKKDILKNRETKKQEPEEILGNVETQLENLSLEKVSEPDIPEVVLAQDPPEPVAIIPTTVESEASADNSEKPSGVKHSRNFRPYCNHFITEEIRKLAEIILKDLLRFQENAYKKNSIKAKANRRYIVGFSEVIKYLEAKKLKLVIISPDCEPNESVDQMVEKIKILCTQNSIPYLFSVKRRYIGYLLLKKVPISCVGIFNYDGTQDNVKELLKIVEVETQNYIKGCR